MNRRIFGGRGEKPERNVKGGPHPPELQTMERTLEHGYADD
jgi:hypothetical protein